MIILGPLIGLVISVAFFVMLIAVTWLNCRHRERLQELAQEERIRRLELDLPATDPDAVRQQSDLLRARLIGLTGLLVPVVVCLSLLALSICMVSLNSGDLGWLLLTAWPVGLVVALAVALQSVRLLRRGGEAPAAGKRLSVSSTSLETERPHAVGIREGPLE
jgi:hypothetical protein